MSTDSKGTVATLVVAAAIALASGACGSEAISPQDELVALSRDADGVAVYQGRCASCHGADLRGTDKGPSQLSIVYEPGHHGDVAYRAAIRNGVGEHHWSFGDMPAVADITDEQMERVIAYVRAEQERLGFER